MANMTLKDSKKQAIKKLGEQYDFDMQKATFKLKRALIAEVCEGERALKILFAHWRKEYNTLD